MKKGLSVLLCCLLAATLLLGGCGGGDTSGTTSGSGAAGSTAPAGDKIVVNYWFCIGSALEAVVQEQIADFNASQDAIEVVGTFQGYYGDASAKIQAALVAGNQPEIVMLERATVPQYHAVGALEDLTAYVERDAFDIDSFNEGLMNFSYYDGQLVSLPLNRSTPILFYNKDAFEAAGLDPEAPPETWDEMIAFCRQILSDESEATVEYGIEFPIDTFVFQSLVPQAGGTMLNEDLTDIGFNNASGLAAFEYLLTLRDEGLLKVPPVTDSYTVTKQDFYSGTVAMMIESTGALKDTLTQTEGNFEVGTAFLPMDLTYAVQTGGGNIGILSACSTEQKDAAWEFIKFMYSEESGAKFIEGTGYIPVTDTIKNSPVVQAVWAEYPQYQTAYDQLSYVVEPGQHANWNEVNAVISTNLQAVIFDDQMTPQQALDAMSEGAQTALAS